MFFAGHGETLGAGLPRYYTVAFFDWQGETVSSRPLAATVNHLRVANWMTTTINSGE
ncbi:hypothetical protein K1Y80_07395 [Streptomyces sp. MAG02]|nr:hypothetical protein [Streptomyces sp. MAG02]